MHIDSAAVEATRRGSLRLAPIKSPNPASLGYHISQLVDGDYLGLQL